MDDTYTTTRRGLIIYKAYQTGGCKTTTMASLGMVAVSIFTAFTCVTCALAPSRRSRRTVSHALMGWRHGGLTTSNVAAAMEKHVEGSRVLLQPDSCGANSRAALWWQRRSLCLALFPPLSMSTRIQSMRASTDGPCGDGALVYLAAIILSVQK